VTSIGTPTDPTNPTNPTNPTKGHTVLEVLAVIAIVAYVIGRQLLGEPLRGKRVILLPAVLFVIGLTRLSGGGHHVHAVDVACLVASGVIGAGQGAMTRLETRDGGLWGRMPPRGLLLWVALIASRVVMTVLASALGAHVAASSAPIVLLLGVNRLGQAAVITRRALSSGIPFAREKDGRVFLAGQLGDQGAHLGATRTPPAGFPDADPYGRRDDPQTYDRPSNPPTYDARPYDTGRRDNPQSYDTGRPYDSQPYDRPARPASPLEALGASLRDVRAARRRARRSDRRPR
jgi:hypothetical protein